MHHTTDPELLSLDELVERTGVAARTIRYYTTRGLLPSPARHGREVRYEAAHVVRLQLVRELVNHGFTLTAIEEYLSQIPDDASPATIELHRTMVAPWRHTRPVTMSRAELEARTGRELTTTDLDVMAALEVATPRGHASFDVTTDRLPTALAICRLGVSPEAAGAAHRVLTTHGQAVAEELTQVFRDLVWPSLRDSGASPEHLQDVVEQFKPITAAALIEAYERAMNAAKRDTVARRANRSYPYEPNMCHDGPRQG